MPAQANLPTLLPTHSHPGTAPHPAPTPAHSPVLGVGTLDVLALLEVGLQVHLEEGRAAGIIGAPNRPVVTAALVVPMRGETE